MLWSGCGLNGLGFTCDWILEKTTIRQMHGSMLMLTRYVHTQAQFIHCIVHAPDHGIFKRKLDVQKKYFGRYVVRYASAS